MGSPLQYPCIKLAGADPFGELCSFKKSLKNFRAMCADTEKHVLPRLDTRGKKANSNRCEAKRLKSPALSCQNARMLKPISAPQAPRVAGDFTQSHSCTFAGGNISFKSTAIIIKKTYSSADSDGSIVTVHSPTILSSILSITTRMCCSLKYIRSPFSGKRPSENVIRPPKVETSSVSKSVSRKSSTRRIGARPEILYLFLPITRIGSP